jgi:hypothetical protein
VKISDFFSLHISPPPVSDATPAPSKDTFTTPLSLSNADISRIAERVSLLMQLDRTHHHVDTKVDMEVLANVPDYITRVFEEAGAVGSNLSNEELYQQVNKRVAQVQAQIYLLRIEMENRSERDPAKVYQDPLTIAAYGERIETLTRISKSFGFDPAILAYGWYPAEREGDRTHRWMRPGDVSVACVPHLGMVDQVIEISGYVLDVDQLNGMVISAGSTKAEILPDEDAAIRFTARLVLKAETVKSANYLPIEFVMTDFRQPNARDTRLLGANISTFTCRPIPQEPATGQS